MSMSGVSLPGAGQVSYGNVAFDAAIKSHVTSLPIYDPAGRTVIAVEYTIFIDGYVSIANSGFPDLDQMMQPIHYALETPGQALQYFNHGWGNLVVNDPTVADTSWDVDFGPKPQLLDFMPMGSSQAAKIQWQVKTRIPSCDSAVFKKEIMMLNYDWQQQVNGQGLSVIQVSGLCQIPMTRQPNSRSLPDSADAYRERIAGPVPKGFKREPWNWKLNYAKNTLAFNWTDTQLPFPLPAGMSYAEVSQSTGWSLKTAIFENTISGSLTVAPDQQTSEALDKFKVIVASRLNVAKNAKLPQVGKAKGKVVKPTVLINDFRVREEIFGLTSHFSCSYSIIGARLEHIIEVSGLFDSIADFNFDDWADSMQKTVHNPRGAANIKWDKADDKIIDLCQAGQAILKARLGGAELRVKPGNPQGGAILQAVPNPAVGGKQLRRDKRVPAEASWIDYSIATELIEDDRVIRHKPLKGAESVQVNGSGSGFSGGGANDAMKEEGDPGPGMVSTVPDVIQRLSAPDYTVRLSGYAIRLGHEIPCPELKTVGGQQATQMGRIVRPEVLAQVGGVNIYGLQFQVDYLIPSTPRAPLELLPNPAWQQAAV